MTAAIITIRELNQNTSSVIERLRDGIPLVVTKDGRPRARLIPYAPDDIETMRIEGRLQPARADTLPSSFEPLPASCDTDIDAAIGRADRDWL